MIDLLPCPFCGGPATLGESEDGSNAVSCKNDGCSVIVESRSLDDEGCIRDWNTRAPLPIYSVPMENSPADFPEPSTITPKTVADFTKVCEQTGILGTEAPKTD